MKLHLKIEKTAMFGRRAYSNASGDAFTPKGKRSTVDDSCATFTISGISYHSEVPENCGIAETINRDLEQLERATA